MVQFFLPNNQEIEDIFLLKNLFAFYKLPLLKEVNVHLNNFSLLLANSLAYKVSTLTTQYSSAVVLFL